MRIGKLAVALFVVVVVAVVGCGESSDSGGSKCSADSTFGLVQTVFESRGCTASTCHGQAAEVAGGGLDLRTDLAYDHLVNVPGRASKDVRVFPGDEELSLLYLKLAAKTEGVELAALGVSGSPMPSSGDALTVEELALVRAWIRGGAPRTGVVAGAAGLLDCDISPDEVFPNKIPPLPPPDSDKGVQLYSGAWLLAPESEDEVCFATYYDLSSQIPDSEKIPCPDSYGGAERDCFTYTDVLIAQDPQSHHAVVETYIPPLGKPEQWNPTGDDWKSWICLGGERDGLPCDPLRLGECGARSTCATKPETSVACVGYPNGPPEMASLDGFFGNAASRRNVAFAQEPTYREDFAAGVYGVLPVKGFTVWNSHSFNLTRYATTLEQYMNFTFADRSERLYQRQELIIFDAIFAMGIVPPFSSSEVCATFTVPQGARLITLSSHTHKHGRDFRIWYPPNEDCEAGPDCLPPSDRPADYRSFTYDDPLNQRFGGDNPLAFDDPAEAERTFRYCAIFDNGAEDPMTVRRDSLRPNAAACAFAELSGGFISSCGCAPEERACLGGPAQGALCGGDDATCGPDGLCDACPLAGGITTEEEMFAVIGSYYVVPPAP
ncbi:MAG TPA: hypothetical protein VLS88_14085 [Polyangiales bacterium]|nr:hypothetical protein [Polyangiales bacterium]